jgi:glycosyltransferase involved in cell wall biosynthesis
VKILLIGNYLPDAQESMQRYAQLMHLGLREAGHRVTLMTPLPVLNSAGRAPSGIWKWIGYLDKYLLSPPDLARAAADAELVHVCDHANSMYVPRRSEVPYVVTCHDLLAVRGALGEDTDCPTGFAGRRLQMQILRGLHRAAALACVSQATLRDAERLVTGYPGQMMVTPNALSYPYRRIDPLVAQQRLLAIAGLKRGGDYILHVGSNLRRKNREGVLRSVAACGPGWEGQVVFAGQPLTPELRQLAIALKVAEQIVEVEKPSNDLLEALYNAAYALLFPSRFEGFGWPIIEAQACGCPVICSRREPFTEVAGDAALLGDPDRPEQFAAAIVALHRNGALASDLRRKGLRNSERYGRAQMIARVCKLYEQLGAAA